MKIRQAASEIEGAGPYYTFWCPGCLGIHGVPTGEGKWTFKGDLEHPTIEPSIRTSGTKMTEKGESQYTAWCAGTFKLTGKQQFDSVATCCHVVVTKGILNFQGDCTHPLAGKSVSMEDIQ